MDLAAAVEEHLFDPKLRKAKYGGWSELVCDLLRVWLEREGVALFPLESEIPQQGNVV